MVGIYRNINIHENTIVENLELYESSVVKTALLIYWFTSNRDKYYTIYVIDGHSASVKVDDFEMEDARLILNEF